MRRRPAVRARCVPTPVRSARPATPVGPAAAGPADATPLRKAAILLVSLEQPLASQLLAQLDRSAVEAVTLEIARLERSTVKR